MPSRWRCCLFTLTNKRRFALLRLGPVPRSQKEEKNKENTKNVVVAAASNVRSKSQTADVVFFFPFRQTKSDA